MSDSITSINVEIEAYERVLNFYQSLLDNPEYAILQNYLEERVHKLNCQYADVLVKREDIKDQPRKTIDAR